MRLSVRDYDPLYPFGTLGDRVDFSIQTVDVVRVEANQPALPDNLCSSNVSSEGRVESSFPPQSRAVLILVP